MAKDKDAFPSNEEEHRLMNIYDHMSSTTGDAPPPARLQNAQIFRYEEVAKITNNFETLIGQGSSGPVFMGKLKYGQVVAVKMLNVCSLQTDTKFVKEIAMLSVLNHPNILKLIGFSLEMTPRLLVYDYLPYGSLHYHLHDPSSQTLAWETRMEIALGVARGLNYLHNEASAPVIFYNLKTANVLLDHRFSPILSDFELAVFGPTLVPAEGYHANEDYYDAGNKADVYHFGGVLFELITGGRPEQLIRAENILPIDFLYARKRNPERIEEVLDPRLGGKYEKRSLWRAVGMAVACLDREPLIRPGMRDVVQAMYFMAAEAKRKAHL